MKQNNVIPSAIRSANAVRIASPLPFGDTRLTRRRYRAGTLARELSLPILDIASMPATMISTVIWRSTRWPLFFNRGGALSSASQRNHSHRAQDGLNFHSSVHIVLASDYRRLTRCSLAVGSASTLNKSPTSVVNGKHNCDVTTTAIPHQR